MNLNEKELNIYNTIKKIVGGEIDKKTAAINLSMSIRNINRLIIKYHKDGIEGFSHKNKGKNPYNKKISEELSDNISNDYIESHFKYNFTHYFEDSELNNEYHLSYSSIYRLLTSKDICSPEAHRKTKRNYLNNMKSKIDNDTATSEQLLLYNETIEREEIKHFRKSSLNYNYGEEVQVDGTFDEWFDETTLCLHLAVDRATKKVLSGEFNYQETSATYYNILYEIVKFSGIPELIKTDRRNTFDSKRKSDVICDDLDTQFSMMCNDLGILLKANSNPLYKPNVERENRTFKSRLKAELDHYHITTIESANKYLKEVFIPKMNDRFSYEINPNRNNMRENNFTDEELKIILSERFLRKIDNASSFKYRTKSYVIIDIITGELVYLKKNSMVYVMISKDNKIYCKYENKFYYTLEIEKDPKLIKISNKTQEEINASKAHKPSENHP